MEEKQYITKTPEETFGLGERIGTELKAGDVVLLYGGLGAGKTLLTKGILSGLDFDTDEVTSPSFALVNLYKTDALDVYHIDLWRLDPSADPASAVGLHEILEGPKNVAIIEWANHLGDVEFAHASTCVTIAGDGDDPRKITVTTPFHVPAA